MRKVGTIGWLLAQVGLAIIGALASLLFLIGVFAFWNRPPTEVRRIPVWSTNSVIVLAQQWADDLELEMHLLPSGESMSEETRIVRVDPYEEPAIQQPNPGVIHVKFKRNLNHLVITNRPTCGGQPVQVEFFDITTETN